jgi:carbon-monoxide dehydrogenase catalytic subunit
VTQYLEGLTGGKLALEADPVEAVDAMEAHIIKKREALGILVRFKGDTNHTIPPIH